MGLPTDSYWDDILKKGPPEWFAKAVAEGKMPRPPGEGGTEGEEGEGGTQGSAPGGAIPDGQGGDADMVALD